MEAGFYFLPRCRAISSSSGRRRPLSIWNLVGPLCPQPWSTRCPGSVSAAMPGYVRAFKWSLKRDAMRASIVHRCPPQARPPLPQPQFSLSLSLSFLKATAALPSSARRQWLPVPVLPGRGFRRASVDAASSRRAAVRGAGAGVERRRRRPSTEAKATEGELPRFFSFLSFIAPARRRSALGPALLPQRRRHDPLLCLLRHAKGGSGPPTSPGLFRRGPAGPPSARRRLGLRARGGRAGAGADQSSSPLLPAPGRALLRVCRCDTRRCGEQLGRLLLAPRGGARRSNGAVVGPTPPRRRRRRRCFSGPRPRPGLLPLARLCVPLGVLDLFLSCPEARERRKRRRCEQRRSAAGASVIVGSVGARGNSPSTPAAAETPPSPIELLVDGLGVSFTLRGLPEAADRGRFVFGPRERRAAGGGVGARSGVGGRVP